MGGGTRNEAEERRGPEPLPFHTGPRAKLGGERSVRYGYALSMVAVAVAVNGGKN